jgi:hypothetical protein
MESISKISDKIRETLAYVREGRLGTQYYTVYSEDGEPVKIRISDHSANKQNNSVRTLSFVTERTSQNKSSYNQMTCEWEVYESGLTDTFQTIEQVLEWNDENQTQFLNWEDN